MATIQNSWEGKRYDLIGDELPTAKKLVEDLKKLKSHGIIGIKQSFEDEGVILHDVINMRMITYQANMDMYVKIGGAEAVTDINNCSTYGINNIIAPMVETEFALRKFTEATKTINDINLYYVCESKTAYENIVNMLASPYAKCLTGVVVGRSDLTKSYNLDKQDTDGDFIEHVVENILRECKINKLQTTLGGNISAKAIESIKKFYQMGLLDKFETRNVVVKLSDSNIEDLKNVVDLALDFEMNWLQVKSTNYISIGNSYQERVNMLKSRK